MIDIYVLHLYFHYTSRPLNIIIEIMHLLISSRKKEIELFYKKKHNPDINLINIGLKMV